MKNSLFKIILATSNPAVLQKDNSRQFSHPRKALGLGAAAGLLLGFSAVAATVSWNGPTADRNWSTAGNWSPNADLSTMITNAVIFGPTDAQTTNTPVNIVDVSTTVKSLSYTNVYLGAYLSFQNTLVASGQTLTITNGLTVGVGNNSGYATAPFTYASLSGAGGTVAITGGDVGVGLQSSAGTTATVRGTLDMSGLDTFSYNNSAGTFSIAGAGKPRQAGVVYLAMLIAIYFAVSVITKLMPGSSDPAQMMSWSHQSVNMLLQIFLVPLVQGPLTAGFYFLILKVIREQTVGVGDLFAGFQSCFAPAYLVMMLTTLVTSLCFLPFNWFCNSKLAPVLEQMQHTQPDQMKDLFRQMFEIFLNSSPVFFLCCLPAIFFAVNWIFALPLVADRQMDAGAALKTSWKQVLRHWWQIFGLVVLVGLLNVAGLLLCCVGLLFTIPLGMAATMVAYEVIFTRKKA